MVFEWDDFVRLMAAAAAGAIIGLERELADKPAGLRTNILICLGAALFALLSIRLAELTGSADRTRIAAQIVTGVGFLGAGAIIQHRNNVVGLTTAATIWAVASVGTAFGTGEFVLGILGAGLVTGVLLGMGFAEAAIARWQMVKRFEAEFEPGCDPRDVIAKVSAQLNVRWRIFSVSKLPTGVMACFKVRGKAKEVSDFQIALMNEPLVRTLREL